MAEHQVERRRTPPVSEEFILALHRANEERDNQRIDRDAKRDDKLDEILINQAVSRGLLQRLTGVDGNGGQMLDHETRIGKLETTNIRLFTLAGVCSFLGGAFGWTVAITGIQKFWHFITG